MPKYNINPLLVLSNEERRTNVEKTLSDFYSESQKGNVKIEELLSTGMIRDPQGMPYESDANPKLAFDLFMADILGDKPVYIQGIDGKNYYKIDFREEKPVDKEKPLSEKLVTPGVKQDAINAIKDISARLGEIRPGKNEKDPIDFAAMKRLCDATVKKLQGEAFKDKFGKTVANFSNVVEEYYLDNLSRRASRSRVQFGDIAKDLHQIKKCVEKDLEYSKNRLSENAKLREEIAAKDVLTMAKINAAKGDPEAKKFSKSLLGKKDAFFDQVEKHMGSTAFRELYGDEKKPAKTADLIKAAASSPKELVTTFVKKQQEVSKDLALAKLNLNVKPQSRKESMGKEPLSQDIKEDIKQTLLQMKEGLDKLGNEGRTSPEFKAFKTQLDIAAIRLNNGSNYINYRNMVAEIAEKADKYYMSKLGGSITGRREARFDAASKIRHIADSVAENKLPSENLPDTKDLLKEDVAAKLVRYTADQLAREKNPTRRQIAARLLENPKVFRQKMDQIMQSREFNNNIASLPEDKLQKLLEKEPSKISRTLYSDKQKPVKQKAKAPEKKEPKKEEQVLAK